MAGESPHKNHTHIPTPPSVSSLLGAGLRLYVAYALAGLLAVGGAFVLFSVGGTVGLVALFACVVVLFAGLALVLRLA